MHAATHRQNKDGTSSNPALEGLNCCRVNAWLHVLISSNLPFVTATGCSVHLSELWTATSISAADYVYGCTRSVHAEFRAKYADLFEGCGHDMRVFFAQHDDLKVFHYGIDCPNLTDI